MLGIVENAKNVEKSPTKPKKMKGSAKNRNTLLARGTAC